MSTTHNNKNKIHTYIIKKKSRKKKVHNEIKKNKQKLHG
jgi:hypothetical protein